MYMVIYCKISEIDGQHQAEGPYIGPTRSSKFEAEEAAKEIIKKTSKSIIPIIDIYDLNKNSVNEAKDKMNYKVQRAINNIVDSQRSNQIITNKRKKK